MAKNIASRLKTFEATSFKIGYHSIPSLHPLHLHILSSDYDSSCITARKHITSFSSPFFVTSEALEYHLESAFAVMKTPHSLFVDVRKQRAEDFLKYSPLACNRCGRMAKALPDWKRHNESCAAAITSGSTDGDANERAKLNSLLGWARRVDSNAPSLKDGNQDFVKELKATEFTIFHPQSELGFY